MDWVWFLFGFDGRINRAKMWLALLVILCWMFFIAMVLLATDVMFGNPVKSIHFSINDIFAFVDPDVLRAAFSRLREGKEASLRPRSNGCTTVTRPAGGWSPIS
jgi:hypothetical protein